MQDTKRYQCRHIFTDGHRCGSPCLRHEEFCYYHHTTRRPIEAPHARRARQTHFDLPLPEDRSAIQCSIGEVLRRIARNEIDPRRAGLLLYGLQIASLNLPKITKPTAEPQTVEEITTDPELGILAPRAEVASSERRGGGLVALLMKSLEEGYPPKQPAPSEPQEPARTTDPEPTLTTEPEAEPSILPEIQAHAETPAPRQLELPARQSLRSPQSQRPAKHYRSPADGVPTITCRKRPGKHACLINSCGKVSIFTSIPTPPRTPNLSPLGSIGGAGNIDLAGVEAPIRDQSLVSRRQSLHVDGSRPHAATRLLDRGHSVKRGLGCSRGSASQPGRNLVGHLFRGHHRFPGGRALKIEGSPIEDSLFVGSRES
jgi:hypothetical protein